MLTILRVTLNRAKMAFFIVKIKDTGELFQMTQNIKKIFFNCAFFFLERNYPESIVDEALGNVSSLTQDYALEKKSVIPFVIEYNPSLPNISLIINKYWDLLQLSHKDSVSSVHAYKPILAFKRPKNLHVRDYSCTTIK